MLNSSIKQIFSTYLSSPEFTQIQHIPTELYQHQLPMHLEQICLLIPFSTFQTLYKQCVGILVQSKGKEASEEELMAADIVLCMNGENEKAWGVKRGNMERLDVEREMKLNEAVCMKFKKSTVVYDYRLGLIKRVVEEGMEKKEKEEKGKVDNNKQVVDVQDIKEDKQLDNNTEQFELIYNLLTTQSSFIFNILKRFYRNYYCWTYRLKLFNYLFSKLSDTTFSNDSFYIQQLLSLETKLVKAYCQGNIHQYSGFWYLFSLLLNRSLNKDWIQKEIEWVNALIEVYEMLYDKEEDGARLYSLKKYKEWVQKENVRDRENKEKINE